MIKRIIIAIILFPIFLYPVQNVIEITKYSISGIHSSEFLLEYSVINTFDNPEDSKLTIMLPFDKSIVQGIPENNSLSEKDFLFSQMNLDLNNDRDFDDLYKVRVSDKTLLIDNVRINPVFQKTSSYHVLKAMNENGVFNINRITSDGLPFILRDYNFRTKEITVGFNNAGMIEFRKYSGNLILVEIIAPAKSGGTVPLIGGQLPFIGSTNEKTLTGGETWNRYAVAENIKFTNNTASGSFIIENISRPFTARITYFFCLAENLVLMNHRLIMVN